MSAELGFIYCHFWEGGTLGYRAEPGWQEYSWTSVCMTFAMRILCAKCTGVARRCIHDMYMNARHICSYSICGCSVYGVAAGMPAPRTTSYRPTVLARLSLLLLLMISLLLLGPAAERGGAQAGWPERGRVA